MSGGGGGSGSGNMDIHFQALCNAVENEKVDKCRSILLATSSGNQQGNRKLDLAAVNNDGFTPLDLAFMTGNRELFDLMLDSGAKEGETFAGPEEVSSHLTLLSHESRKQVDKFGQLIKHNLVASTLSPAQLRECEKQQTLWQKRLATLRKLKQGFDSSGCPHAPAEVTVEVLGKDSLCVRLKPPENATTTLHTKCRVQWSSGGDAFAKLDGELTVTEVNGRLDFRIDNLLEGQRYFVRASFGNPKGFGPFAASTPKSVVPSSWRSVEDRVPRLRDQRDICVKLYKTVTGDDGDDPNAAAMPLVPKKKGLRNLLFSSSSAPKFQRQLHPNRLYLSCAFFHEDKVLMTNEESLPVMEVDDEVPNGLMSEFQWLSRLCFVFRDVERLRAEAAKQSGHCGRFKLLQTVLNMQHGLGVVELGRVFHRVFRHPDGSVVISLVNQLKNPKQQMALSLSLKWVPLSKASRRSSFDQTLCPMDALRHSLREQMLYHQVCSIKLNRGLYLCYLQAESNIDSMKVTVSSTSPSILPYVKVRDNPHVTADEWSWLGQLGRITSSSIQLAPSPTTNFLAGEGEEGTDDILAAELKAALRAPTENQYMFGRQLLVGMERLLDYLEIDDRRHHRLFDSEVVELSPDVSVVLVLPSADHVCSISDLKQQQQRNDLMGLNLQLFETVHLSTYHHELLTAFYRVLLHLDLSLASAKQNQREAFSAREVEESQAALNLLLESQQSLEDAWKPMRWLLDVLSQGRNKAAQCGVTYEHLSEWYERQREMPDDSNRSFYTRGNSHRQQQQLQRTPTTRSDPLEFNLNNNKENEVHNFPRLPQQQQELKTTSSSSFSSLTFSSHQSTNSSLSSSIAAAATAAEHAEYENMEPANKTAAAVALAATGKSFDPRVAQFGRFSNISSTAGGHSSAAAAATPRPSQSRFQSSPEPNVLQVFAAYDTGLASGTSVKLNVNQETTTREVIDLVIKQLNMTVILKGKEGPVYENFKNFCLVAVIGSRERCLRDDFRPLNLQNPWKKGKLFVRMKNDLLAAIEHISRHSTVL